MDDAEDSVVLALASSSIFDLALAVLGRWVVVVCAR
jgi:hypothetical protein